MGNSLQKNSQKPQEDEEDDSTLTCEICTISSNKKFKNNHNCTHSFCTDCMASYIQVKVEDQRVPDIVCPALDCDHLLDALYYRPILPAKLFVKWSDLLCEKAVLLGFERCYCPNQTCSVLIVNECGGNVRRSKCPNCKKLFCFQCKSPWHPGYRCDEKEEMKDMNDALFGELVETKKWARCPTCGHCVELVEGCPNVHCRCSTKFCYECGGKLHNDQCQCNDAQQIFAMNVEERFIMGVANARPGCLGGRIYFAYFVAFLWIRYIIHLPQQDDLRSKYIDCFSVEIFRFV